MANAKPVLIISSDWHIEDVTWTRRKDLRGDSIYSLAQIIDYQLKTGLPHIALGDLFETPEPTPHDLDEVANLMELLKSHNLPLYFVQGQHELVRECPDVPWLSLTKWPKHIHHSMLKIGGFNIYGLDYAPLDKVCDELDVVPPSTDILATHQVWQDFIPISNGGATFKDVSYARYVITGDYHKHLIVPTINKQGAPMQVISPGSICLKKLNEPVEKAFFVLHEDGSFQSMPIRTRPVYRFTVDNEEQLDSLLREILPKIAYDTTLPEEIRKPILHVVYGEATQMAGSRIIASVGDRFHVFAKLIPSTVEAREIDASERQERTVAGMTGCLELLAAKGSPVYKMVTRLLSADSIDDELQSMYVEALNSKEPADVHQEGASEKLPAA